MAHWAEIDEDNVVIRVLVGDNDDPNGDEGYKWLVDNLGGTWIKCSFNTVNGVHREGGIPLRWTYPGVGYVYHEAKDSFIAPQPHSGWVLDNYTWIPPIPQPDTGAWIWNDETENWEEYQIGQS